jgi:hypothetical protein
MADAEEMEPFFGRGGLAEPFLENFVCMLPK